jgi:excisionase family DNA binding protein
MITLSLREAAEQAGVSKSTIFRAIQSGRMSAERDDDRNFKIQPAELFRVYPPKPSKDDVADNVPGQAETQPKGQDAPALLGSDAMEIKLRNIQLEEQIKGLQAILEMERQRAEEAQKRADQRAEELRAERDRWANALEASQRQITHLTEKQEKQTEKRSGWWPFRRAG